MTTNEMWLACDKELRTLDDLRKLHLDWYQSVRRNCYGYKLLIDMRGASRWLQRAAFDWS